MDKSVKPSKGGPESMTWSENWGRKVVDLGVPKVIKVVLELPHYKEFIYTLDYIKMTSWVGLSIIKNINQVFFHSLIYAQLCFKI